MAATDAGGNPGRKRASRIIEGSVGNKGDGSTEIKEISEQTRRMNSRSTRIGHGIKKNKYRQLSANSESPSRSFPG
jgi:hypothetical protein